MAPARNFMASLCLASCASAQEMESNTLLQSRKLSSEVKTEATSNSHAQELAFVESLAKTTATEGVKIDEAAKTALQAIDSTLSTSLDIIQTAHTNDQTGINDEEDVHTACKTTYTSSKAEDATLKSQLDTKRSTHATCRASLKNDDDDKTTKCNSLDVFVEGLNPPACQVPDGVLTDYFVQIRNFVDANEDVYKTKKEQCDTATTTGQNTETTCDSNQQSLESAACALEVSVYSTCNTYNSCESTARAAVTTKCESAEVGAEQRRVEWRSIKKIKCYVDKILNSADLTVADLEPCQNLDPDLSHLTITCPTLPDKEDCDFSPVADVPCNAGWLALYDGMIGLDECTECAPLAAHLQSLKDGTGATGGASTAGGSLSSGTPNFGEGSSCAIWAEGTSWGGHEGTTQDYMQVWNGEMAMFSHPSRCDVKYVLTYPSEKCLCGVYAEYDAGATMRVEDAAGTQLWSKGCYQTNGGHTNQCTGSFARTCGTEFTVILDSHHSTWNWWGKMSVQECAAVAKPAVGTGTPDFGTGSSCDLWPEGTSHGGHYGTTQDYMQVWNGEMAMFSYPNRCDVQYKLTYSTETCLCSIYAEYDAGAIMKIQDAAGTELWSKSCYDTNGHHVNKCTGTFAKSCGTEFTVILDSHHSHWNWWGKMSVDVCNE